MGLASQVNIKLENSRYYTVQECADTGRNIAKIHNAVNTELMSDPSKYYGVLFIAGCCDVTSKEYLRGKRNIFFPHRDMATCRAVVSVRLSNMIRKLTKAYPEIKFSVCTIFGTDLQRLNHKLAPDPKQQMLNDSIKLLKQDVMYLNRLNGVPTCKLHKIFHRNRYSRNKKGRGTNAASRHVCLYGIEKMWDGCHANEVTQLVVADKLAETIKLMFPVPKVLSQEEYDVLDAKYRFSEPYIGQIASAVVDMEVDNDDVIVEDDVTDQIRRITLS